MGIEYAAIGIVDKEHCYVEFVGVFQFHATQVDGQFVGIGCAGLQCLGEGGLFSSESGEDASGYVLKCIINNVLLSIFASLL